jgi:hypothetical protein
MHVKNKQDNLHCMNGTPVCAVQWLWVFIYVSFMVKCVLYRPWIQWLFVAGAALMGGHYRMNIISGVGHPRSDSVVPLVFCMVVCNA